ncbi:hypothetical protein [Actinomadura madurae]|uniref:hypothetical protein n=1 Tax=Actinomadura madurae TaxID=1993 RepID=UPI0020D1FF31|nr:hypothetical protein [Actinomadura madurae]MCP9952828.1 hypothetical protein [Actinomadura madurae]MCP9969592.1 hypothetical protein [Actinomadura madurae]MCP9982050.1 hypothetical protein [Actinomadura madurae]MCQ0006427.1 hypothetical protein [Actinomadura madurae]MCQ0018286.1 hypothetical protein [Actinomadura madurae]
MDGPKQARLPKVEDALPRVLRRVDHRALLRRCLVEPLHPHATSDFRTCARITAFIALIAKAT